MRQGSVLVPFGALLSCPALLATHPKTSLSQRLQQYVKEGSGKGPQWRLPLGRVRLGSSHLSSCLSLQFRENVQDVLPTLPNPDDYFLLRWLRGEGRWAWEAGAGAGSGQRNDFLWKPWQAETKGCLALPTPALLQDTDTEAQRGEGTCWVSCTEQEDPNLWVWMVSILFIYPANLLSRHEGKSMPRKAPLNGKLEAELRLEPGSWGCQHCVWGLKRVLPPCLEF